MNESSLPKLTVSAEKAREKIQQQIEKGEALCTTEAPVKLFDSQNVKDFRNACVRWSNYNKRLLDKLLGNRLDYISFDSLIANVYEGIMVMRESINSLVGICEELDLYEEHSEPTNTTQHSFGNDVFIVHGRDDGAKETVARFVEGLGMNAIILHERPSGGRTIIEKIEKYSDDAGFAIVLITPDDVGGLEGEADDERNPRPRQNVVFELGYFMGKLGRERVCPLFKGEVENPSDIDGIVYINMDDPGAWKEILRREISAVIQEVPDE